MTLLSSVNIHNSVIDDFGCAESRYIIKPHWLAPNFAIKRQNGKLFIAYTLKSQYLNFGNYLWTVLKSATLYQIADNTLWCFVDQPLTDHADPDACKIICVILQVMCLVSRSRDASQVRSVFWQLVSETHVRVSFPTSFIVFNFSFAILRSIPSKLRV